MSDGQQIIMAEVSISQADLAKSPSELITKENLKGSKIGSASFVFFSEFSFIFTLGEGCGLAEVGVGGGKQKHVLLVSALLK